MNKEELIQKHGGHAYDMERFHTANGVRFILRALGLKEASAIHTQLNTVVIIRKDGTFETMTPSRAIQEWPAPIEDGLILEVALTSEELQCGDKRQRILRITRKESIRVLAEFMHDAIGDALEPSMLT